MFGALFMWSLAAFVVLFILVPLAFRTLTILVWITMIAIVVPFALINWAWSKVDHFRKQRAH